MSPPRLVFLAAVALSAACALEPTHDEPLAVEQPVLALSVNVGSGDLHIVGADVSGANVVARVQGDRNHLGYELSEGRLSLFEDCHEDPCAVSIAAIVPAAIPFEIRTGSGDVRIEGALEQLLVDVGSGDVEGIDLAGRDLRVKSGSGDIDLSVFDPTEVVSVRAGSGDVSLAVPSGSYRLSVDTGSGDRSVKGIIDDASAGASIAVDTGSGDVRVRGR
ncbi:MAG: hypothetical protein RL685_341 [Pseudomonadota bacterium]|jgi:hypothetical protein